MEEQLKQLEQEALAKIEANANLKELNEVRVAYLGKKGPITDLLKGWANYQLKNVRKWVL